MRFLNLAALVAHCTAAEVTSHSLHVLSSADQAALDCSMCASYVADVGATGAVLVRAEQHASRQRQVLQENASPCPCSTTTTTTTTTTT
eukprot:4239538-Amphidinium_carterae.1